MANKKLTKDEFWRIVDTLDWEASAAINPNYHLVLREKLLPVLHNKQLKRNFGYHIAESKMNLSRAIQLWGGEILNLRDVEVHGLLTHIIGCGSGTFNACLRDPSLIVDMFNTGNYVATFEHSVPTDTDYEAPPPMGVTLESDVVKLKKQIVDCEKNLFSLRRKLTRKINQLEKLTED